MELGYEALKAWQEWPVLQDTNLRSEQTRFFHNSGWVVLPREGSDVTARIRANFRERRTDVTEDVALDEDIRGRWDGVLRDAEFEGLAADAYWNPDTGWADAGAAVEKMMAEAVGSGVRYECGDVERLVLGERGVKGVKTKNGSVYEADMILLATGGWTSEILSATEDELNMEEEERVERQVKAAGVCVVHYKLDDAECEALKDMPVLMYGDAGEAIPPPARSRLLKFTNARSVTNSKLTASGHRISVPPDRDQNTVPEKLQRETIDTIVKKLFPKYAQRIPEYWRMCWDSITPAQDQLITKHPHPRLQNLFLAVGGSFHSWKFLPIIGEYVANVLHGVSNGEEKDRRWAWKMEKPKGRGAHEKVVPRRELSELE